MTQTNVKRSAVKTKPSWLYVLLGIIIMMCLGTVYSWSVFRLHVEELYNIGSTQSGLPYMISLAIYAIFMILTGKIMDKYSPRLIILIGGLLIGLGWILSGFAQNVYVLTLTFGVITGAGVGIVYGAPLSVVAKWFPKQKGLMVGLVLIGFGLSPFVTAPIARNLVETYGVLKAFQILGVTFGLIIPLLSLPFQFPSEADSKKLGTTSATAKKVKDIDTQGMVKSKSFKGF